MRFQQSTQPKNRCWGKIALTSQAGSIIVAAMAVLAVILIMGLTALTYITSSKKTEQGMKQDLIAVQVAEAGIHKAIYCLNADSGENCGGTFGSGYAGESTVDVNSGYFSTSLTGDGVNKTVTSVGSTYSGYSQTVSASITTIPPSDEIDFAYALQSGDGGAHLENNAVVHGTLYTNGDVTCQTAQAIVDGDIYISLADGMIDSCRVNYHAYADNILNSEVQGDAYYKMDPDDIAGSTVTGTKYSNSATPDYEPMPDINLDFWRESAALGGTIYGDYVPSDGEELGPIKIDGNLIMNNNIDIVVTGPIWVVGDISTGNNCSFTLEPDFGEYSTVILADHTTDPDNHGKVTISNNTAVAGSGNPQSHILFVSTNTSTETDDPALSVSNNSAGAIFFSTAGTLALENNAGAKSLAAYRLHISQNSEVTYAESELADAKFSNSPGARWRLKPGEWRQVKETTE
jgi:hypothetical protein